jgi:hypothetical protein
MGDPYTEIRAELAEPTAAEGRREGARASA